MPARHFNLGSRSLRQLASEIETGLPVNVTIFEHGEDVVAPEYGDAIIDRKWVGRTIVIQTEHVNLDMLLDELLRHMQSNDELLHRLRNKNGMRE